MYGFGDIPKEVVAKFHHWMSLALLLMTVSSDNIHDTSFRTGGSNEIVYVSSYERLCQYSSCK